jgi:uncharacterized membrane protein
MRLRITEETRKADSMRTTRLSQFLFAVSLLSFGIYGFIEGGYAPPWEDAPKGLPGRQVLAYVCNFISIAGSAGVLWRRSSPFASRFLFGSLLLWLLTVKLRYILLTPTDEVAYQSWGETAVITTASWVIYGWSATAWDKTRLGFACGATGLRIARIMYGLAMIAFGLSHFFFLQLTAPLIPAWLPWHEGWAYLTGATYCLAGAAIIVNVWARCVAALSTLQMGLITLLVWLPIALSGHATAFQWREFAVSWLLTVSGWVLTESYRTRTEDRSA